MNEADITDSLVDQVKHALEKNTGLSIIGGDSHGAICPGRIGAPLQVSAHRGIIDYQPTELSLQVRAGTTVKEVRTLLAQAGQMLPFEPADKDGRATIGGVVATALAGPRRGYVGGVADYVLGATLLNGHGEVLHFGGQVMKNVAGFDVSRYLVGGYGCSGILLDISFKVLPLPACEKTFQKKIEQQQLPQFLAQLRGMPVSASSYHDGMLTLRFSAGGAQSIDKHVQKIALEEVINGEYFWCQLREQQLAFFDNRRNLTLCMLPPSAIFEPPGDQLIEWHGSKRWLADSSLSWCEIQRQVLSQSGHTLRFGNALEEAVDLGQVVQRKTNSLQKLQRRLRFAFDPQGIFNRGQSLMPWLEIDSDENC